jgi:hypothetical protein
VKVLLKLRAAVGRVKAALSRAFDNWETTILRQVVTNLSTASIVFLVALLNTQFRNLVFPPEVAKDYPLICRAEPYVAGSGELAVDFFIINRSANEFARDDLARFLRGQPTDSSRAPTPSIGLIYWREQGKIAAAESDREFNMGKGDLNVSVASDGRKVTIEVQRIVGRAVMKVVIETSGLDLKPVNRMSPVAVPFQFQQYQDACYGRE